MVKGRRGFRGTWPLARMRRLSGMLARQDGEASFEIQFDTDETAMPFVEIRVTADCWLTCQRTLEPYAQHVEQRSRLGIIASERDEAALPEGYEPFLVTEELVALVDLVEDELILALPLVPRSGDEAVEFGVGEVPVEETSAEEESPFAALAALKSDDSRH